MVETLKSAMPDRGAPLPENLILDDIDGCRVEFSLHGDNNETGHVIVRVSKGGNSEMREIPLASFEKNMSSFTIQIRVFSPSGFCNVNCRGGMNLKGADLPGAILMAENLCGADLSGANLEGQYCLWRIVKVRISRAQICREHH